MMRLIVGFLFICSITGCTLSRLRGTWSLVTMITIDSSRNEVVDEQKEFRASNRKSPFDGLLIYTKGHHFSANIYRKQQPVLPQGSLVKLIGNNSIPYDALKEKMKSGLAYYGTYVYKRDSSVVYHEVIHSSNNFENSPIQKRTVTFVGGGYNGIIS